MKLFVYMLLLLALTIQSALAKTPTNQQLKIIYAIAIKYKLDANDLIKIAKVESNFNHDSVRINKNQSIDIGMFQINSIHWTTTCINFNVFTLRGNAECAAKLIRQLKNNYATIDINWLGRYHSSTHKRKMHYIKLLAKE